MRGKGLQYEKSLPVDRITPAYAGKREKTVIINDEMEGSPPPMRGKD